MAVTAGNYLNRVLAGSIVAQMLEVFLVSGGSIGHPNGLVHASGNTFTAADSRHND